MTNVWVVRYIFSHLIRWSIRKAFTQPFDCFVWTLWIYCGLSCVPTPKLWRPLTILRWCDLPTMSGYYVIVSFWAHPLPLLVSPFLRAFQSPSAACILDWNTSAGPFLGRRGLWTRPSRQVAHESSSKDSPTAFQARASYPQLLQDWSIELLPPCWFRRMRTKTSKDLGNIKVSNQDLSALWIICTTRASARGESYGATCVLSFSNQFCWEFYFLNTHSTCHHYFFSFYSLIFLLHTSTYKVNSGGSVIEFWIIDQGMFGSWRIVVVWPQQHISCLSSLSVSAKLSHPSYAYRNKVEWTQRGG